MAMETFRYFSGHFTDPLLSGLTGAFFAREMHSTSEFAKIVLSKSVCVSMLQKEEEAGERTEEAEEVEEAEEGGETEDGAGCRTDKKNTTQ